MSRSPESILQTRWINKLGFVMTVIEETVHEARLQTVSRKLSDGTTIPFNHGRTEWVWKGDLQPPRFQREDPIQSPVS